MINAGRMIARIHESYCEFQGHTPTLVDSIAKEASGIGQLEKKEERHKRILAQRTQQLAAALWEEDGRPDGGSTPYWAQASKQLGEIK